MEESKPPTTINDLPDEMLEMVVPDLKPETISTLRLINWRFNRLFTYDRYYKPYLLYPEKYFLCAMKSEKNSGKEVIGDIKSGEIGKWRGYLTLEKLYIKNWRSVNITCCECIPLPNFVLDEGQNSWYSQTKYVQSLIDEDGEQWILISSSVDVGDISSGIIIVINVTSEQKMCIQRKITGKTIYEGGNIDSYFVKLIPGQIVCILRAQKPHIVVYDIIDEKGEISLQYKFDFVFDIQVVWRIISGKSESSGYQTNTFVSIGRPFSTDGILRFRDLRTGNVLREVPLFEYKCLEIFRNRQVDDVFLSLLCGEDIEFPYVVITIYEVGSFKRVVVVYDVEHMLVSAIMEMPNAIAEFYCITKNVIYTFSNPTNNRYATFVHYLPLENHRAYVDELKTPKLLYRFVSLVVSRYISKDKKLVFSYILDSVRCITVDGSEVKAEQVTLVDVNHKPLIGLQLNFVKLRFIGPDMLVGEYVQSVKIFKLTRNERGVVGEEWIDLKKALSERNIDFSHPKPVYTKDISKLILYDVHVHDNDCLAIFHF